MKDKLARFLIWLANAVVLQWFFMRLSRNTCKYPNGLREVRLIVNYYIYPLTGYMCWGNPKRYMGDMNMKTIYYKLWRRN